MSTQQSEITPENGFEKTKQRAPSAHLERLFAHIVNCVAKTEAPPTYEEIGKALGYSKGLVARRVKQLHEEGRLVIDDRGTARTLRIALGQGYDDLATKVYLTEDRKALIKAVNNITARNGIGPSINRLAHELGFSNSKTKRHVKYLDDNEFVRYSPELNEVIIINPGDYEPKPND